MPHGPTGFRQMGGVRGFNRIANILAIAVADLTNDLSIRIEHGHGVRAIGTNLLAADVHLGGAVNVREVMSICARC